jgi:hypothetical protein
MNKERKPGTRRFSANRPKLSPIAVGDCCRLLSIVVDIFSPIGGLIAWLSAHAPADALRENEIRKKNLGFWFSFEYPLVW